MRSSARFLGKVVTRPLSDRQGMRGFYDSQNYAQYSPVNTQTEARSKLRNPACRADPTQCRQLAREAGYACVR